MDLFYHITIMAYWLFNDVILTTLFQDAMHSYVQKGVKFLMRAQSGEGWGTFWNHGHNIHITSQKPNHTAWPLPPVHTKIERTMLLLKVQL
jgi:hypothetical protein